MSTMRTSRLIPVTAVAALATLALTASPALASGHSILRAELVESSTDPSAARCATLRPGRGRVPIVLIQPAANLARFIASTVTTTTAATGTTKPQPEAGLRLFRWPGAGSNRRPSDFQSDARTN